MIELDYERGLWQRGMVHVAGVDEAGRGPLAGPVVAAAVMFPPELWIEGIDDSKKLSPGAREEFFAQIQERAQSVGIGVVSHQVIDQVNILQASLQAMEEAVSKLQPIPEHLLVDGRVYSGSTPASTTLIDGDALCFSIAAASIIAKVTRDRIMVEFDQKFPQYGFAKHKGYGTKEHYEAIEKFGPCEIHRRSFRLYPPLTLFSDESAGARDER